MLSSHENLNLRCCAHAELWPHGRCAIPAMMKCEWCRSSPLPPSRSLAPAPPLPALTTKAPRRHCEVYTHTHTHMRGRRDEALAAKETCMGGWLRHRDKSRGMSKEMLCWTPGSMAACLDRQPIATSRRLSKSRLWRARMAESSALRRIHSEAHESPRTLCTEWHTQSQRSTPGKDFGKHLCSRRCVCVCVSRWI